MFPAERGEKEDDETAGERNIEMKSGKSNPEELRGKWSKK